MFYYICLDKYSDWLEADSVFVHNPKIEKVQIIFLEDLRNNQIAVEALFDSYKGHIVFEYKPFPNRQEWFHYIKSIVKKLEASDIIAAPFIRYRDVWKLIPAIRKTKAVSVHLSESLPDSFGLIGYRFGFRLVGGFHLKGFIKQICIMPFAYFYAMTHKPDICFYNMYPNVSNPFVKKTSLAEIPQISQSKRKEIIALTNGEKRTLLLGGFGYDYERMAKSLGLTRYVATSKHKEIIIDGIIYPLEDFICAEEVLLSGIVDKIIGYNSSAVCWAYRIEHVNIETYESSALNRQFGFLFGHYSRKAFGKCGINLLPEKREFICFTTNSC